MVSAIFAISGSLISGFSGHPSRSQELSLETAVQLAVKASPRLRAHALEIRAAELGLSSARSLANPTIAYTPGFTRDGSDEELFISQPLEISGTRSARTGVASAELLGARAAALVELRTVVYETTSAYYELARLKGRLTLTQEIHQGSKELEAVAQRQVELGSRAGIELSQIRIETTRAKQQTALIEAEYGAKLAEINTLLGQDLQANIAQPALRFEAETVSVEGAIEEALRDRAELKMVAARREKSQKEAALARAEGRPDLAPHYRAESLSRSPRSGGFGVGISLPFLDYGSRKNRIKQAETLAKAEEEQLAATERQIRLEVKQAIVRLNAAAQVLASFEDGLLIESWKVLEASRRGFELGETSLVSLLEAQRTYRSIQTESIDALASHLQAKAALDRALGRVPASLLPTLGAKAL